MEFFKLQAGCLILISYIGIIYFRECRLYKIDRRATLFDKLLLVGIISIIFDGTTAYTVNHLEAVPNIVNLLLHLGFLISLDVLVFILFLYILFITETDEQQRRGRFWVFLPLILNLLTVIVNIPSLEYRIGKFTNYSMGISVYTCYIMAGIYMVASIAVFIRRRRYIERRKQISIFTCLASVLIVAVCQSLMPEALITCLVPTIVVLGAYMNQEDPAYTKLENYHQEMVVGFATLVENRDNSTGGHIRRTTAYVELLAKELRTRGFYRNELTKDYTSNLIKAAPMHDVGKIAIPDAILQKPGRLTSEEFEIMKTHAERGGQIIQDTFRNLGVEQYQEIAFQVARYHHEKWNGRGYPEGLSRNDIPLCARIMAVADVFDAVSAKRCYRDAMPLEQCFQIIQEGSGQDFDPIIADVFLDMREQVEAVYRKN